MNEQPRRKYVCSVCGKAAYRRHNTAVRFGNEDADQPLLHVDAPRVPHNVQLATIDRSR